MKQLIIYYTFYSIDHIIYILNSNLDLESTQNKPQMKISITQRKEIMDAMAIEPNSDT